MIWECGELHGWVGQGNGWMGYVSGVYGMSIAYMSGVGWRKGGVSTPQMLIIRRCTTRQDPNNADRDDGGRER